MIKVGYQQTIGICLGIGEMVGVLASYARQSNSIVNTFRAILKQLIKGLIRLL